MIDTRITKKKALDESVKLWEWLYKTGMTKRDYAAQVDYDILYYVSYCPLCEYAFSRSGRLKDCAPCPAEAQLGCTQTDSLFVLWLHEPSGSRAKKAYAKQILDIIKEL